MFTGNVSAEFILTCVHNETDTNCLIFEIFKNSSSKKKKKKRTNTLRYLLYGQNVPTTTSAE